MKHAVFRAAVAAIAMTPLIAIGSGIAAAAPAPDPAPEMHDVVSGNSPLCAPLAFLPPIFNICKV